MKKEIILASEATGIPLNRMEQLYCFSLTDWEKKALPNSTLTWRDERSWCKSKVRTEKETDIGQEWSVYPDVNDPDIGYQTAAKMVPHYRFYNGYIIAYTQTVLLAIAPADSGYPTPKAAFRRMWTDSETGVARIKEFSIPDLGISPI